MLVSDRRWGADTLVLGQKSTIPDSPALTESRAACVWLISVFESRFAALSQSQHSLLQNTVRCKTTTARAVSDEASVIV